MTKLKYFSSLDVSEQASGGGLLKLDKPRCLDALTNKNNTFIGGIK